MARLVGSRIVGVSALMVIAGCTSGDDTATSATDLVGSVPVVVTISEALTPVESSTPDVGDVETKDIRTRSDDAVGDGVRPEGFTAVNAVVTSADGETCAVCLWLADVADERARGLMGVTDLGDAAGMAFVFDEPGEGAFVMIGTPTPLSIAWFDADGGYVSAREMEPCTEADPDRCERYRAEGSYTLAIEMLQGELDVIGIGPGASVEVLAGTESVECAAIG